MIKAVFWDLDGTLVETESMMPEVNGRAVAAMGYQATSEDAEKWHGMSDYDIWLDALAKGASNPLSFEAYKQAYLRAFDDFADSVKTRPGAVELVRLFSHVSIPQAVVTSALRQQADSSLSRFPDNDKFLFSVTADDVPEGRTKPDPYPYASAYLYLREGLKDSFSLAAEECLVIEDSPSGVLAGHRAGMQVVHWLRDRSETPSPYATIVIADETDMATKLMPLFLKRNSRHPRFAMR